MNLLFAFLLCLPAAAEKTAAQWLEQLDSTDTLARQFAAANLGDFAEEDAVVRQVLLGALSDWEQGVRVSASYALSKAGPKSAAALKKHEERRLARLADKLALPHYLEIAGSVIELKRSSCTPDIRKSWGFVTCPEYKIRVHGDGAVLYEGGYDAPLPEDQAFRRDSAKVQELLQAFSKAKFFELEDAYEKGAEEARIVMGDVIHTSRPFYTLTLWFLGEKKEVRRFSDDETAPKVLAELEAAVDALAGLKGSGE